MRLTRKEYDDIYGRWIQENARPGESDTEQLYRMVCEAEDAKGIEAKPGRRAELLELAGKLIVATWSGPSLGPIYAGRTQEETKAMLRKAHDNRSEAAVSQAASIIAAVDKALE